MKLFTEKQRTTLLANGAQRGADHVPVVKLFNPSGAGTWLLSELDPEYQSECGFGLADLGFGTPELGSVDISELTAYRGPFARHAAQLYSFRRTHSLMETPHARRPHGGEGARAPAGHHCFDPGHPASCLSPG